MEACELCAGTKKICVAQVGSSRIIEQDCPECIPTCDRCGGSLEDGVKIWYGRTDPETAYREQEIICAACDEEDGQYEQADADFDMAVEEAL